MMPGMAAGIVGGAPAEGRWPIAPAIGAALLNERRGTKRNALRKGFVHRQSDLHRLAAKSTRRPLRPVVAAADTATHRSS